VQRPCEAAPLISDRHAMLSCSCDLVPTLTSIGPPQHLHPITVKCSRHIRKCLIDQRASSRIFSDLYGAVFGRHSLVSLDGEIHHRLRGCLLPLFGPAATSKEPREIVWRVAERLCRQVKGRSTRSAELVRDIARILPAEVLTQIFGLDPNIAPLLSDWSNAIVNYFSNPKAGLRAAHSLQRFVTALVLGEIHHSNANVMGQILDMPLKSESFPSQKEVIDLLRLVIPAALETTSIGIGNVLASLLSTSSSLESVLELEHDLKEASNRALMVHPPVGWLVREATGPIVLDKIQLPAGQPIMLSIADGNRDLIATQSSSELQSASAGVGFTFGLGRHSCVGMSLAMDEIVATVDTLHRTLPTLRLTESVTQLAPAGEIVAQPSAIPVRWS
jgi:2-hydroxy-5-methyl-1-naphthoate 7-hydroxylase